MNLFTFVIRGQNKVFFIEHLENKYPIVIIKNVVFNSLAFVHKLRDDLAKT